MTLQATFVNSVNKFKLPMNTAWMRDQMEHESTRSYAQEIYEIVKEFPYENALEIGSAWGVSALAILTAQPKGELFAVDPSDQIRAPSEIKANKLENRWYLHQMRSDKFWEQNKMKYDLIYVDGSHLYQDVKPDLFNAWETLNSEGLLIWDDFVHPANQQLHMGETIYGVSLASWELVKEKKITKLHTTTRLLYVYKNEQ